MQGDRILWYHDATRNVVVVCAICMHDHMQRKLEWIQRTMSGSPRRSLRLFKRSL